MDENRIRKNEFSKDAFFILLISVIMAMYDSWLGLGRVTISTVHFSYPVCYILYYSIACIHYYVFFEVLHMKKSILWVGIVSFFTIGLVYGATAYGTIAQNDVDFIFKYDIIISAVYMLILIYAGIQKEEQQLSIRAIFTEMIRFVVIVLTVSSTILALIQTIDSRIRYYDNQRGISSVTYRLPEERKAQTGITDIVYCE